MITVDFISYSGKTLIASLEMLYKNCELMIELPITVKNSISIP